MPPDTAPDFLSSKIEFSLEHLNTRFLAPRAGEVRILMTKRHLDWRKGRPEKGFMHETFGFHSISDLRFVAPRAGEVPENDYIYMQ